jgi:GNAT superfamily N-acetyltransferase
MKIELSQANKADIDFAFEAKKQAMGPHIESKWGGDENFQRALHGQRFSEKPWFIILVNGESVGTVSIDDVGEHKRFGEFYLLTKFQRRGIGTKVLNNFLRECDIKSKKVFLEYLKWNPVGSLYKRNGFEVTSENEIHYFMIREPVSL